MSYPLLTNFGGSYESQAANMNNSSNSEQCGSANNRYAAQASYPGDVSQPQLSASGYDWADQHQQNYPNSESQRTNYNSDAWDNGRTQVVPHNDRSQQGQYVTQAAAGDEGGGHNYHNSTPSHMAGQNNSRLSNLAYASGMDDAALQRQGHRKQHSTGVSGLGQFANTINHIRSPATTHGASWYDTSQPLNYGYQNDPSSQNQQNSLLGAGMSSAGNVSARFQQATAAMGGRLPTSPALEKSASMQQSAQRSASPYHQSQNPKTQGQGYRPSTTPQTNDRGSNSAALSTQEKPRPIANTGSHRRGPSLEASQQTAQPQSQLVNSISNLVTPMEAPAQDQYSATLESQSMPSYIDPTQVFNPFHKEHQMRRREAAALAEAEARRKAEEEASTTAKNRVQIPNPTATATPKINESNNKTKQKKQPNNPAQSAQKRPLTEPQSDKGSDSTGNEADMAARLKAMMEQMQEYRNKDPVLFQKLWDDLRKTSSVPPIAAPAQSPQMGTQNALHTGQSRPQASTPVHQVPPTPELSRATSATQTARVKPDVLSIAPLGAKLNGYKVIVENNPEGLPDSGRFPAERRIRTAYQGKHSSETDTTTTTANPQPIQIVLDSEQYIVPTPAKRSTPAAPSTTKPALLTQGLPAKVNNETIWPEDKRNALTEVAVKFLVANPDNANVEITPQEIHQVLEQNPSYIDLCQTLEKKGLKFHRGQFARQLLSEVPQLRGPSKNSIPPAPPGPSLSQASVQAPAPGVSVAPGPLKIDASASASTPAPAPAPAPTTYPGDRVRAGKIPAFTRPPGAPRYAQMPRPKPLRNHQARPEPVPGPKEAMARKRDFSEIIDLTALSDNEDYVMSQKQARVESPSPGPTDPLQEYQNQSILLPPVASYTSAVYPEPLRFDPSLPQYPHGYVPLPHYPPHLPPSRFPLPAPLPAPAPPPQRSLRLLAKPINKEEAFRKTYYDAKTVARDVLIAAGRHPTERPLNAHLAGLLGKFVEIDSDLSTFNWDAIDPKGPPVPQVPYVDVPTNPPRFRLGESTMRRKGQAGTHTPQKHSIPDQEKPRSPAPAPAATVPAPATAPATNKVVTPQAEVKRPQQPQSPPTSRVGGPPQGSHVAPRPREVSKATPKPVIPQKRRPSLISSNSSPNSERRRSARSISVQVPSTVESKTMNTGSFFPSGKRRGRPPGAKNLHPSVGAMQKAAVQELPPIEVTIPSPASPSLPVFKCRWRGCKAHLHNLQTLQSHVSKVHRPTPEKLQEEGGYICWWKKCEYLVDDGEGALQPSEIFDNQKDWLSHIEEHTNEVASRLGDGPTTKIIDPQTLLRDKARYLSDEQGRITTPDVSVKSAQDNLEPDTMTLLKVEHNDAEKHAQRSFMKTHLKEKSNPRAVAEETLKAVAARKAKIGPGIDRGGCILANEARRATFIQNPGIQRVVDGDY